MVLGWVLLIYFFLLDNLEKMTIHSGEIHSLLLSPTLPLLLSFCLAMSTYLQVLE